MRVDALLRCARFHADQRRPLFSHLQYNRHSKARDVRNAPVASPPSPDPRRRLRESPQVAAYLCPLLTRKRTFIVADGTTTQRRHSSRMPLYRKTWACAKVEGAGCASTTQRTRTLLKSTEKVVFGCDAQRAPHEGCVTHGNTPNPDWLTNSMPWGVGPL